MKYIDRTKIGMELFLDQLSPMTSPLNHHSPEETVELLSQDSYSAQTNECRRIQGGLRRLISSRYALRDSIPARVRMVAESQFTPTPDRLLPVFRWIHFLRNENEQARIRWLYALKDVGSALGGCTGDFLQSFSQLASQRVSLLPNSTDFTLTLSVPDSFWGQVSLCLTGIDPSALPPSPVFGYLFWIEADRNEDAYTFRFLMDTEFSDTVYQERLLQTKNWQEIAVRCTHAQLQVTEHDYTSRIRSYGYGETDALFTCFGELLRKQAMLGSQALSGGEARLLSTASLFSRLEMLPNSPIYSNPLPPATQLMENRYQLNQTASFLDRECGEFGTALAAILRNAANDYANENARACQKKLNHFRARIRDARRDGSVFHLTHPLLALFRDATSSYCAPVPFARHYEDARTHLNAAIELLQSNGFSGQFPHFYRLRRRAEYISFVTDGTPIPSADGLILLNYSLAVASCPLRNRSNELTAFDLPYRELSATSCAELELPGYRFGRVYSPRQDGHTCSFGYHYDARPQDELGRKITAETLCTAVQIAIAGLEYRRLPDGYHPHTAQSLRADHAFLDLFNRCLPFGIPVACALLIFLYPMLRTSVAMPVFLIGALLVGLIAAGLLAGLRFLLLRRTIWRR